MSPNFLIRLVGSINSRLNRTKSPYFIENRKEYLKISLGYFDEFKNKMSKNVCDWNAGIYMSFGKYVGAQDIKVYETACIEDGDNDCIFKGSWIQLSILQRLLLFLHCIGDPDYIKDRDMDNLLLNDLVMRQKGIIEARTSELL